MFYDVPCVGNITDPTFSRLGNRVARGKMLYVIFDCPFEAMSFARKERDNQGLGVNLQVNRREWSDEAWFSSRIVDRRNKGI